MPDMAMEIESTGESRINRLLRQCPEGTPMTSPWLREQGVTPQLAAVYGKSGWLTSLGRGAWIRTGRQLDWKLAVYALQSQLNLQACPAGTTALELQGRAHYIPLGKNPPLFLGIPSGQRLPDWFTRQPFAASLSRFNSTGLFDPACSSLINLEQDGFAIRVSSPERAMLELCHMVPRKTDTEEVMLLMQGLTNLHPQRVQEALMNCRSVKAKRLFLVLAEIFSYQWFEHLDLGELDLGSGKRVLPVRGKMHARFQITVPEPWDEV